MSVETAAAGKRVLAIDDDPSMLDLVSHILRRAGYEVDVAADGSAGLQRIRAQAPDIVLCDVSMPGMDGFATLESIRADAVTAALPFVLLTALDNRENVRRGMRLGADDFLSKPVRADELIESVGNALDKRRRLRSQVSEHVLAAPEELRRRFERGLGSVPSGNAVEAAAGATGRMLTQTVVYSDILDYSRISERLPAPDIAQLLGRYLSEVCKPILREKGRIVRIMGDGVMAMFGHESPEDLRAHARSALRCAFGIVEVADELGRWIRSRPEYAGLPPLNVGIGVHTGEVLLFQLSSGEAGEITALGDAVNVATRLQSKSRELGWPIVASISTIEHGGPGFDVAERRELDISGRPSPISFGRLVAPGTMTPAQQVTITPGLRAVLDENARASAVAAKEAIDGRLQAIGEQLGKRDGRQAREPEIRGYRVLAKIGEGGMSTVFLAEDTAHGRKAVLKILKGQRGEDEALWKRFFQECAILSSIDHEHIVRIYDQGFGEELAYLAMEYLGGGSLREQMDKGLTQRQALSLLSQAASALVAIHGRGIVHRDIKPANMMLRESGVLVLTDFGVAKRLEQGAGHTLHGEVLGTPFYIAPEQAYAGETSPRADLYSLGVIFYEMLMRQRPYKGSTVQEILAQHYAAPIPRLPAEMADCQPLVDRMLAKRPEDRFESAEQVLAEIDDIWTRHALRVLA